MVLSEMGNNGSFRAVWNSVVEWALFIHGLLLFALDNVGSCVVRHSGFPLDLARFPELAGQRDEMEVPYRAEVVPLTLLYDLCSRHFPLNS